MDQSELNMPEEEAKVCVSLYVFAQSHPQRGGSGYDGLYTPSVLVWCVCFVRLCVCV